MTAEVQDAKDPLNPLETDILNGYSGRRILITGGAGYIATNLIKLIKGIDCHIIRLDRPGAAFTPHDGRAIILDAAEDVMNPSIWKSILPGIDIVFHFAAQTSVYKANQNPSADMKINVVPMLHLLETCRQDRRKPRVLFSGTVTETGIPSRLPVDESHTDFPITIYDLHKLMAENYLKYYAGQGFVDGATLRLANVFGPGPKSSSADRGVLNMIVRKALKGEPLTIYGQGEHLRDYVYVEDVARAFLMAGMSIEPLNGRHFVIGTGTGHKLADAIRLVAKCLTAKTGRHVQVSHIDPPGPQSPIEERDFIGDSNRFHRLTGWRPLTNLEQGIISTMESLL